MNAAHRRLFAAPRRRERPLLQLVAAGLMAVAIWQLGGAAVIHAKAGLAPVLIKRAWAASTASGQPVRPWPWADTWPVAELSVPELGIEQYVLAGTNGAALPFGPGHMDGTALPGEPGSMVIAAHRDTHFRFLSELQPGALIRVRGMHGSEQWFRVSGQEIVDASRYGIVPAAGTSELVLVTCQPTDALRFRGPLRLVVTAVPTRPPVQATRPAAGPPIAPGELLQASAVSGCPTTPGGPAAATGLPCFAFSAP